MENVCEEFGHFKFVFILEVRLGPYPTEALEPSATPFIYYLPLHCFSRISTKPSGHYLKTNVAYDKNLLIFYNENLFGLVELGQGSLQSNAEIGGEGGSHDNRDIICCTSFYGLSAENFMRDLQFL